MVASEDTRIILSFGDISLVLKLLRTNGHGTLNTSKTNRLKGTKSSPAVTTLYSLLCCYLWTALRPL
jgi:hypothetical protein